MVTHSYLFSSYISPNPWKRMLPHSGPTPMVSIDALTNCVDWLISPDLHRSIQLAAVFDIDSPSWKLNDFWRFFNILQDLFFHEDWMVLYDVFATIMLLRMLMEVLRTNEDSLWAVDSVEDWIGLGCLPNDISAYSSFCCRTVKTGMVAKSKKYNVHIDVASWTRLEERQWLNDELINLGMPMSMALLAAIFYCFLVVCLIVSSLYMHALSYSVPDGADYLVSACTDINFSQFQRGRVWHDELW
jgi:hypothetical protein